MDKSYGSKLMDYIAFQLLMLIVLVVILTVVIGYIWEWIYDHISISIR